MATVAEQLRCTEKGQLTYHTKWSPRDVIDTSRPTAKVVRNIDLVFEIKSIKAALEAIDDDAQTFYKNMEEENARESRKEKEKISSINVAVENSPFNFEIIMQDCDHLVYEEKRLTDQKIMENRQKFYDDIVRKTHEAAILRREQNMRERREKEEKERIFYEELEESSLRIRADLQKEHENIMRTRQQQDEERRKKLQLLERQRQKEIQDKFTKICTNIRNTYNSILTEIQSFEPKNCPEIAHSKIPVLLQSSNAVFKQTDLAQKELKHLSDEHVLRTQNDFEVLKSNQACVTEELAAVSELVRKNLLEQQELLKQQRLAAEAEKAQKAKLEKVPAVPKQTARACDQKYQRLKAKMAEYESTGAKLTGSGSPELKKLVMHLSKSISVPIGSITGRSGSDIKRVSRILTNIVKGDQVTVGNKTMTTKGNSIAIKFAENLIAKKLVSQAITQVSSNFSSAFSIALIVIAVWAESADFGDLFLAHLQTRCIYAVPKYHKLSKSGGDDDLKKMGYEIGDDGQIEGQDIFLGRMSGLIRLYAAIIQSPAPPGVRNHPHGLANGWLWFAEFLNMEPIPDISTTVLFDFLEVSGHMLMKSYKSQFEKLLYAICYDFYPKLEAVSDDKASLARLKMFLEKCMKEKKVPVPEGRLDKNFWNTYHSGQVVGE